MSSRANAVITDLLLGIYLLSGGFGAATGSTPSTPPIECDIQLPGWCIPKQFDGDISLLTKGDVREWSLQPAYTEDGPIVIIEDRACSGGKEEPSLEFDKAVDHRYRAIKILLSVSGHCGLEFRLPIRKDVVDGRYIQAMLYDILICRLNICDRQIYQIRGMKR